MNIDIPAQSCNGLLFIEDAFLKTMLEILVIKLQIKRVMLK